MEDKFAVLQIELSTKKITNDFLKVTEDPDVFCKHKIVDDNDIDNLLNKHITVIVYIPLDRIDMYRKFINNYYALDTIPRSKLPNEVEELTVTVRTDVKRLLKISEQIDNIIMKYTKLGTMTNLAYDTNELVSSPNNSIYEIYGDNVTMTDAPVYSEPTIA